MPAPLSKILLTLSARLPLLVLLLTLMGSLPALAQQQELPPDTPVVRARALDQAQLEAFRQQRDFQYRVAVPPPENPLARLWYQFWQKVADLLENTSYYGFWRYVFFAFFMLAAGFVILRVLKIDVAGIFRRRGHRLPVVPYETLEENIHAMDFEQLIAQAVEAQNYRLAVRLHYLRTLKTLTDRELISWKPDRTNRSYLADLQAPPLRQGFEKITTLFEYAWYGHFAVDARQFESTASAFGSFHQLLHTSAAR